VTTPRAAAGYARISSDLEGSGLGVTRQVEDGRRLAATLGWTVVKDYVDNDLSAYSGKVRPAYLRMLEDVRDACGTR
jgi:site-specific DNA recombinase